MAKIAIITVAYNSNLVISEFLKSVFKQSFKDWRLYIYDNSNCSQLDKVIQEYDNTKITYIKLHENIGFSKANNLGINQAIKDGYDYVLLINNDTVFEAGLFQQLIIETRANHALIVAPKMLHYPATDIIWWGGGFFNKKLANKNVHVGLGNYDAGQFDRSHWVDFAPMCCVLIKVDAFKQVGLLDENYFVYYEDVDWMYRAKLNQINVWYAAEAKLFHKVSSLTGGTKSDFTIYHSTLGKMYFIKKFYSGFAKYWWLSNYVLGFFVGLLVKRYSWHEFKIKLKTALGLMKLN